MLFLGVHCGLNVLGRRGYRVSRHEQHDTAAVLLRDNRIVAAVEEERLNRIKHSNHSPLRAVAACLALAKASLDNVDIIAHSSTRELRDAMTLDLALRHPHVPDHPSFADFFVHALEEHFGCAVRSRTEHCDHHLAHAVSAFSGSGFEESLVVTLDATGDLKSGTVAIASVDRWEHITDFGNEQSLGLFYLKAIGYLGYGQFDEYKVMGLAPYGDPHRLRGVFRDCYELTAAGGYRLHPGGLRALEHHLRPRRRHEPFAQIHRDAAAALQETLETIALHVLTHHREATGLRHLCLAGGVAHNCSMNGQILRSGLFDHVFVQPAAHDAGAALGAAQHSALRHRRATWPREPLTHVYLGPDLPQPAGVEAVLSRWHHFIDFTREDDICRRAAKLIAEDRVIGWVQGRSEFGPRALGNRSILADPRPARNKDRINAMVKKRAGYRPFAPSVLREVAHRYFEIREDEEFPFMTFVVGVRPEMRELLGAVTHVDGTARLHTVTRTTNERYWRLIDSFRDLTGVPILLNTSFNNNAEPIVDSATDAIVTYLTTGLDDLVIGDYLVRKKPVPLAQLLAGAQVTLPEHVALTLRQDRTGSHHVLENTCNEREQPVSRDLALMLTHGHLPAARAAGGDSLVVEQPDDLLEEVTELLSARLVRISPSA